MNFLFIKSSTEQGGGGGLSIPYPINFWPKYPVSRIPFILVVRIPIMPVTMMTSLVGYAWVPDNEKHIFLGRFVFQIEIK